jgi:hypothetical protein
MPEDDVKQPETEQVTQEQVAETEQTEESTPSSAEDTKVKYALQLFEALQDPETAPIVVKNLAEKLGLFDQQTPKQQKQTIRSIKDVVKEKLGDQGSFIANELGEALETILAEREEAIRKEFMEIEARRAAKEFEREYNSVIRDLKVTEEEAGELMKLVQKFPWNGETPLREYLTELTEFHRSKAARVAKQQTSIKQRPKAVSAEANEEAFKTVPNKPMTPREAVEFAIRQLKGE